MLNFKVTADDDVYANQTNTYGAAGERLQTALTQFMDTLVLMRTSGSLEGPVAEGLVTFGERLRLETNTELADFMRDRGGDSYNFIYDIKQEDRLPL